MHHIGDYKTALNQLTEKTFTPAHREMAESLNRDAYEQLVRGIAEGRRKTRRTSAPSSTRARSCRRTRCAPVSSTMSPIEDQIDDKVRMGAAKTHAIASRDYARVSPASRRTEQGAADRGPLCRRRDRVGPQRTRSGERPVLGSDTFIDYMRMRCAPTRAIKAIVLRIDSPGGSTVASDVIWRELTLTREAKPERPLIVSMSDLAASGGYYIAMPGPGDRRAARTLTGSIGIFGGKIVTGRRAQQTGRQHRGRRRDGKHADMNSPARPYNADERAKLEEQLPGVLRSVRREGRGVTADARRRRSTPSRRAACGPAGRPSDWPGGRARRTRSRGASPSSARRFRSTKDVELVVLSAEAELLRDRSADQFRMNDQSAYVAALLPNGDRRALSPVLTAPLRLFRRGSRWR